MKNRIVNYTFDKEAKTVTFTDYVSISLESILLITNVTTGTIIFDFKNAQKGGTVSNNVLTLEYNTSQMSNIDKLQIFYDDGIVEVPKKGMIIPLGKPVKLTIPTYEGSNQPVHPSVVVIPAGWNGYKYWMAFTPYPNGDSTKENPSILVSNDCITWTLFPTATNPVVAAPGTGWNADPILVFTGTALRLYYSHYGTAPIKSYWIETTDGITWSVATECTGVGATLTDGGIVRISATEWIATPAQGTRFTHERYTSVDGTVWVVDRPVVHNLGGTIFHSQLLFDGAGIHFLTNSGGWQNGITTYSGTGNNLYYGFSLDGYRVAYDPTPILIPENGTWYSKTVYTSCIIPYTNQEYLIFVSGANDAGVWSMGIMRVRLNINREDLNFVLPQRTQRVLFNAEEIRDQTNHYVGGGTGVNLHEFNEYQNKVLICHNLLDQDVKLKVYSDQLYYSGSSATPQLVTIVKTGTFTKIMITAEQLAILGKITPEPIKIFAVCETASPTTGSFTCKMVAWN